MSAIEDVIAERERQIAVEGWTAEHDDGHTQGELARAAASYALHSVCYCRIPMAERATFTKFLAHVWPFSADWWRPTNQRRDLVKASALLIAEIERLDRIEARAAEAGQ